MPRTVKNMKTVDEVEYGILQGKANIETPIVDLYQTAVLDTTEINLSEDDEFEWLYDTVREEFQEEIKNPYAVNYGFNEDEEDDDVFLCFEDDEDDEDEEEQEDEEDEEDEDFDEFDEIDEIDENYFLYNKKIFKTLMKDIDKTSVAFRRALGYIIDLDDNLSYKLVMCNEKLSDNDRFEMFTQWVKANLINEIRHNLYVEDENGLSSKAVEHMFEAIDFLDNEKDYLIILKMYISLMYLYRYIFALVEQNDMLYNYMAEKLYEMWEKIESLLYNAIKYSEEDKQYILDTILTYLFTFENSYSLSLIDSKMYLYSLVLYENISVKMNEKILEIVENMPCNYVSNKYRRLSVVLLLENNIKYIGKQLKQSLDDTHSLILADIYDRFYMYEKQAEILENVRKKTENNLVLTKVLDDLEYAYKELDMHYPLENVYFQKLELGDKDVFSDLYKYILSQKLVDKEDIAKLMQKAKESLAEADYLNCLIENNLYSECLESIHKSESLTALKAVARKILRLRKDRRYNNDELNEFIAQALKALDNNSILSYDKRISSIIKRYV